jgi:hypothetical protein
MCDVARKDSQSMPSFARATAVAPDRTPLARPAMPIDIAAFSYQWSVLKIARRIFFFSGLVRGSDVLALVDLEAVFLEGTFFAIIITRLIPGTHCMLAAEMARPQTQHSRPARRNLFSPL